MEVAPGGLIKQALAQDSGQYIWGTEALGSVEIRIVEMKRFEELTGKKAPPMPELPSGGPENLGYTPEILEYPQSLAQHQATRPSPVAFTKLATQRNDIRSSNQREQKPKRKFWSAR